MCYKVGPCNERELLEHGHTNGTVGSVVSFKISAAVLGEGKYVSSFLESPYTRF